ncbi:nuclear pore complex protein Nup50-like [Anneissia japonica]|uniref:nuclear pore complex protein Nup50-like n=1 Tax=Anneissia japonica TaxID=1529436 RepID=UPI001425969F|nr:nuclear pore complex protein Nup50-like [Anneissia japonica]XP_033107040.1 nuclear pore complex protein Nup50-like [Anneissia japonica]XP_033107041.1 nuclear pore complex protein Nup50-like [Anneissia japonica]XP_033107042.1 nuclear pore complex protein Nup50-like [Anneissia japonica]
MPKRDATSELTDRNWDQEDEPEEAGTFQVAASKEIEKRVIKKARRRVNEGGGSESAFSGFKGFGGFGAKSTTTATSSMFNLGSSKPNGGDNKQIASFSFAPKPQTSEVPMFKVSGKSTASDTLDQAKVSSNGNNSTDYTTQLQSLNTSVLAWIKKHVDENPVCDLSPIFKDYKKHLADIEKNTTKSEKSELTTLESVETSQKTTTEPAKPQTAFTTGGFTFPQTASESKPCSGSLLFGSAEKTNSGAGLFKPVSNVIGQSATSGLNFGKIKPDSYPLSFGGAVSKDEDEYEPPKAEVKEIKEKDSLFTIRCKLFYKSDDGYKDKGVGNLHLKKMGAVAQLIIRADTNLGNIILNIGLPPNIPLQRQGKNNVMIVIPPNPPLSNKCPQCNKKYLNPQGSNVCESGCKAQPVPLLVRVKTAEDADKLLEEIKKIMK